jgi:hypothetical protein
MVTSPDVVQAANQLSELMLNPAAQHNIAID